ncbi:MAG TPA: NotI family restriction endonuclease [Acidobacteriota bacterium]|nr:NotI family restriction endonuclease [Acidobacteriota bacterium]
MSIDPRRIIGEILGQPAPSASNLASADHLCPFIHATCVKRAKYVEGPFPVCSAFEFRRRKELSLEDLVCTCPKRFFGIDLLEDVVEHCWPEKEAPEHPQLVHEVRMKGVGTVDLVVADCEPGSKTVRQFVSVELQAVDITGTYADAYLALLRGDTLETRKGHSFNWANVRKRFASQLIQKSFFHQQWRTKMACIVQDSFFERFRRDLKFHEVGASEAHVIFLIYRYAKTESGDRYNLVLDRVMGTTHSSLMNQSLYSLVPERSEFCKQIVKRLT